MPWKLENTVRQVWRQAQKAHLPTLPSGGISGLLGGILLLATACGIARAEGDEKFSENAPQLKNVISVVLDPGHGGADAGALGQDGANERDLAWGVADDLVRRLQSELGVQVILTRPPDAGAPASARVALANNAKADVFISLHVARAPKPEARGVAIYYSRSDGGAGKQGSSATAIPILNWDQATARRMNASAAFAEMLRGELVHGDVMPVRPLMSAPLADLTGATMPAIVMELGFITSPEDVAALSDDRVRSVVATSIARALRQFDTWLAQHKS